MEQLVKLENEDETKTEIHFDDLSRKVETKMKNYITVKKDLVKTENRNYGEFSKSEEEAIKYCLESMGPNDTKKRKIDFEFNITLITKRGQNFVNETSFYLFVCDGHENDVHY